MKRIVILSIDPANSPNVRAEAFGADTADIYIKAATLQEAMRLLPDGEALAQDAIKTWKPAPPADPAPEKPQKLYWYCPLPVDEVEAQLDEYAQSPNGKRIANYLRNAKALRMKTDGSSWLSWDKLKYMQLRAYKSELDALLDMYAAGYARGYRKAKKASAKK